MLRYFFAIFIFGGLVIMLYVAMALTKGTWTMTKQSNFSDERSFAAQKVIQMMAELKTLVENKKE